MTDDIKTTEGTLPSDEVFSATLVLRSVGNSPAIIPEIRWSHQLKGDFEERMLSDQIPYAFIAMAKIMEQINAVMKPVSDETADKLPEDLDEAAKVLSALNESKEAGAHN